METDDYYDPPAYVDDNDQVPFSEILWQYWTF